MRPLTLLACLFLGWLPAAAQAVGPAGIEGRITGPGKAPVAQARITITSEANRTSYRTTSDARGGYQVLGLPPGLYTLEVVVPALKVAVYKHVRVRAGKITRLNAVLRLAPA